jgi:hypothetical protein
MEDDIYLRSLTKENIYETITADPSEGGYPRFQTLSFEEFERELDNLRQANRVLQFINEDSEVCYTINTTEIRDYNHLRLIMRTLDDLSKVIYSVLSINQNKAFWTIKLGQQKTKTDQMIKSLVKYMNLLRQQGAPKIIPFLFSLNDLDLSDQTMQRFLKRFTRDHKIFVLSSGKVSNLSVEYQDRVEYINARNIQHILDHIELYVEGRRQMPIIISLPNPTQVKKVCNIIDFIKNLHTQGRNCGFASWYDEVDAIYKLLREFLLHHICSFENEKPVPTPYNLGQYYVSATIDQELTADFPEISAADQIPIALEPDVEPNYRNIDHEDSTNPVPTLYQRSTESNNSFILRVVTEYIEYFKKKNKQRNGVEVFKRTIALADLSNAKQEALARKLARLGMASIVFNQSGFILYYPSEGGYDTRRIKRNGRSDLKLKGMAVNEKLFTIYKHYPILSNFPLFILGNKKIDRGLSFHYAPKDLNEEAFLLSDEIMGCFDRGQKRRACQAAARLWGVIGHRPEYVGYIGHWFDSRTSEMVLRDARLTKHIELNSVIMESITHLMNEAESNVEEEIEYARKKISEVGPFPYDPNGIEITTASDGQRIKIPRGVFNTLRRELDFNRELPTSFCVRDGYIISTRIARSGGESVQDITASHRFLEERLETEEYRIRSEIKPGNSLNYTGSRTDQNFLLLPDYPNETSSPDEVLWWVRFVEPLRDKNNQILFINDNVRYNGERFIIAKVHESEDGDQIKATLKRENGVVYSEINPIDSENPTTKFSGYLLEKI